MTSIRQRHLSCSPLCFQHPMWFPNCITLATGGHSVELGLSTLLWHNIQSAHTYTHTHSLTVQWVEWQLPKRHAHVQITGTCVLASSQKEFFQMNFEMKSTWIIQIHWPVSFQEEGRGSLRQIQEEGEPRMTEPQARVYLKPPEAGRDKGAQSFQHLPRKQSWFWTFGLQNCEHTFLLF